MQRVHIFRGEPRLVGGLKGADMLKVAVIVVILLGCVLETLGNHVMTIWMQTQ